MAATVSATNGAGTSTPLDVLSPYETSYEARSIVHDLIDGGIAVSLIATRPRNGDILYLFDNAADAHSCAALHELPTSFVVSSDLAETAMEYIVTGSGVRVTLDPQSRIAWTVTVGYQAI